MSTPIRLLILEDEPADAEMLLYELRRAGFEPDWQCVETEADYLAQLHEELDVIVADYVLPQFDALRALHLLQKRGLDIPFIVVSGRVGEEVVVECVRQGAADYLLKDRLMRLGQAVSQALQEKKLRDEKRQAEAALREGQDLFRLLAENVDDLIYRFRLAPPPGFEYISPSATAITGYTPEEHYADPDLGLKIVHPDDRPQLERYFQGEGIFKRPIVMRWVRKDGSIIWTEQRNVPIYDEAGELVAMQGVARDITGRKRAEEALRKSQVILSEAERMARLGSWEWDIERDLFTFSREWQRIHGLKVDRLSAEELWPIAHSDDRAAIERAFEQALAGVEPYDIEHRIIRQDDGEVRFVRAYGEIIRDDAGEPVRMYGAAQDVTERKQAEDELRESEKRYRELVETLQEGIWAIDEDARTTFVNPRMADMLGYTVEEMEGKHLFEFMDERGVEMAKQNLERRQRGVREQHDFEFLCKDGTRIYARMETCPITDADGNYVGALAGVMDTTERRQAEVALRESEKRLALIFDNSSDLLSLLRIEGEDGFRVVMVNPAFLSSTGFTAEQVVEKRIEEYLPEPVYAAAIARFREVTRTRQSMKFEQDYRLPSGHVWYEVAHIPILDEEGNCTHILNVSHDVTERARAERALQESEAKFRAVAECAPVAIFIIRGENYLYVNPAFEAITGYSEEEALSMPFWDVIHPDDRELVRERGLARQRGEDVPSHYENKILTRDGGIKWVDFTAAQIEYDGRPATLGTAVDISDRVRSEKLIQASLREKEVLVEEIHHRVKNNLQVISSLLDLQSESVSDPQAFRILQDSRSRIGSMALVHEKLYQSGDVARVDVAEYVQSLVEHLSGVYGDPASEIDLHVEVDDIYLGVDAAIPCGLIINELVSNALVHAFPAGEGGEIRVEIRAGNGRISLAVADDGVGLSPDLDLTDPPSLGLRLVRALTRQLKGTLEIDGSRGTRVEIELTEVTAG